MLVAQRKLCLGTKPIIGGWFLTTCPICCQLTFVQWPWHLMFWKDRLFQFPENFKLFCLFTFIVLCQGVNRAAFVLLVFIFSALQSAHICSFFIVSLAISTGVFSLLAEKSQPVSPVLITKCIWPLMLTISLICRLKSSAPCTLRWGTPDGTGFVCEQNLLRLPYCIRVFKYALRTCDACPNTYVHITHRAHNAKQEDLNVSGDTQEWVLLCD